MSKIKAVKMVKPVAMAKPVKKIAPVKMVAERNTDALEAPHKLKGMAHQFRYK
jgi:hypothetical protein